MKQLLIAGTAFLALGVSHPAAEAEPIVFDFTYTGSLVTFMVLTTDTYQILAFGAQGGRGGVNGGAGGRGAEIGGNFNLTAGEMLEIAVGGAGLPMSSGFGGGGGSFVVGSGNTPLIIAGGGGGGGSALIGVGSDGGGGETALTGGSGIPGGNGGVNFLGGAAGESLNFRTAGGGGGGGFLGDGGTSSDIFHLGRGGGSFLAGFGLGNFGGGGGGGGSPDAAAAGGGGGGASGGGGGSAILSVIGFINIIIDGGGGGGGSFDAGTNQILMADIRADNGEVIITEVAAAVPEPASLAWSGAPSLALPQWDGGVGLRVTVSDAAPP